MGTQKLTKVLVIDDSALIRALLTEVLETHPSIKVVGAASDPYEAREMIKRLVPDVLTLDIEMPRMNGITFLKNLMRLRPMPVVMISTLTQEGAPATLEALELGAVDFVPKPKNEGAGALENYSETIIEKVLCAARANLLALKELPTPGTVSDSAEQITKTRKLRSGFICAIGASTGGTEAIKEVVLSLPENSPPVVVAQHIPAAFSASFARRVDAISRVRVFEAENNQKIEPGCVYIAPGSAHLRVARSSTGLVCRLGEDAPINRHRPSVEALFDSVTDIAGGRAMGVMLTGMGADGAEALLRMRQAGAVTVCQDEATSVVWGMPGAAHRLGAATKLLPLEKIGRYILTQAFE